MSTTTTAPAEIMWMPAGTHIICATINGKPGRRRVVVEGGIVPKLNAELAAKQAAAAAHQAARPVVLFDHQQGAAAAFPRRFRWQEGLGIMLELSGWSQAGRAAVEGGNYGYISPSFLIDRRSSRVLGLTDGVEICSLVNDPAFECIHPILDAIAASRAHDLPADDADGVDIVTSSLCNEKHITGCPNGSGKWQADPKWSFNEAVQNAFAADNKPKKAYIFKVCSYPDVMKKIVPWEGDITIRWDNMEKIHSMHGLTPEQIADLPRQLDAPIAIMEDPEKANEFLIVTDLEAPDRKGHIKKAAAVLKMRLTPDGVQIVDIASAYARDDAGKYKKAIERGNLRYIDKERAEEWAKMEGDTILLLLPTIHATPGSGGIKAQHSGDVKGENAPYAIFSALLAHAAHCNQYEHDQDCPRDSSGSEVQLAHDTTGLQAHLKDEVTPVEITFTPENLNLKQLLKEGKMEEYAAARKRWLNEFKEHYQTQLAGKTVEVEGSGHSIYFPESRDAKSRAAKGVRTQARAEAGKNMAHAVASSYHLHQSTPEHKEGEGEYRRKMVDTSDSFHVFGCPITVNGERSLMWIAATHKKAEANQKNLVFYEFGVAESTKKAGEVPLVHGTSSHRTGTPPAKATLLDVLRDVKSDFQGKPKFLQKVGGRSRLALDAARDRSPSSPTTGRVADAEPDVKSYFQEMLAFFEKEDEAKSAKKGRGDENFTRPSPGMKPASPGKDIKAQRENAVKDNFYEFGVADSAKKAGEHLSFKPLGVHRTDTPPAEAILADEPRDVKHTHASHCNQHEHAPGCPHEGGSSTAPADDAAYEADLTRQEELERLESLLSILDEEEESARDAESAGDPAMHRPEHYREKWNNTAREGDPITRDDIEKRIAQLQDTAQSSRATQKLSPRSELAKPAPAGENTTAKATHHTTMNENIKKKLGLAPDASDEDVEAAISKLAADRDAHKKKAEEAAAACKQKDDELKAARAAEKEDWLTELKRSGRIAPQDEEAISAASALFEADAANARLAYSKIPAANDAPVIQASAAPKPGTTGDKVEDFIDFPTA